MDESCDDRVNEAGKVEELARDEEQEGLAWVFIEKCGDSSDLGVNKGGRARG